MSWIDRNKKVLRACLLVGLVVAFLGPWVYDQINVPAEFTCSPPNVRLYGDFCGTPLPGTWLITSAAGGLVYTGVHLYTDAVGFQNAARGLLFILVVLLFVLPFLSTLIVILRAERRGWRLFNIAAWALALGLALLLGLAELPRVYVALWGVWLYAVMAVCALVLEVRWLRARVEA